MTNLLSTIQSSLKSQPTTDAGKTQTEQAQSLASTAQTGKAQAPGSRGSASPALSNLAEKAQNIQAQQAQNQLMTQAQLEQTKVDQKAAEQAQSFAGQTDEMSQARISTRQKAHSQLKGMLQQTQQSLQSLNQQDMKSREEQIGTLARLSNDQYIHTLNQAATKANLDDEASFNLQLANVVFEDERELLESDLNFMSIMGMEHRDAMKAMANIDLETAISLAKSGAAAAGTAAMASGVSQVGGGLAQYYANKPTAKTPTNTSTLTESAHTDEAAQQSTLKPNYSKFDGWNEGQ